MWILVFVTIGLTPMTAIYAPGGEDAKPLQFKTIKECVAKGIEIGDSIHESLPLLEFKAQCMRVTKGAEVEA